MSHPPRDPPDALFAVDPSDAAVLVDAAPLAPGGIGIGGIGAAAAAAAEQPGRVSDTARPPPRPSGSGGSRTDREVLVGGPPSPSLDVVRGQGGDGVVTVTVATATTARDDDADDPPPPGGGNVLDRGRKRRLLLAADEEEEDELRRGRDGEQEELRREKEELRREKEELRSEKEELRSEREDFERERDELRRGQEEVRRLLAELRGGAPREPFAENGPEGEDPPVAQRADRPGVLVAAPGDPHLQIVDASQGVPAAVPVADVGLLPAEVDDPYDDLSDGDISYEETEAVQGFGDDPHVGAEWLAEVRDPLTQQAFEEAVGELGSLESIREIVEAHPGVLAFKDVDEEFPGWTLLHHAVSENVPEDTIRYLVDQDPQALQERSAQGLLPLHVAAKWGSRFATFVLLTQAYPEALLAKTHKGDTPLHLASRNRPSNEPTPKEVVTFLAMAEPRALQVANNKGHLPLHKAARYLYKGRMPIVEILTVLYPGALWARANDGKLPLHMAAKNGEPTPENGKPTLVRFLFEKYPEALLARTVDGQLPLHCAAKDGDLETVQFLFDQNPATLHATTNDGSLPLHFAALSRWNAEVAEFLLGLHPEAVEVASRKGWYPLHCAAKWGRPKIVRLLADKYPPALHKKNQQGLLPIHIAAHPWKWCTSDAERQESINILASRCTEAIVGSGNPDPPIGAAAVM